MHYALCTILNNCECLVQRLAAAQVSFERAECLIYKLLDLVLQITSPLPAINASLQKKKKKKTPQQHVRSGAK